MWPTVRCQPRRMTDLARGAQLDVLVEGYARRPNVAGTVNVHSVVRVVVADGRSAGGIELGDGALACTCPSARGTTAHAPRRRDVLPRTAARRRSGSPGHTPQDITTWVGTPETSTRSPICGAQPMVRPTTRTRPTGSCFDSRGSGSCCGPPWSSQGTVQPSGLCEVRHAEPPRIVTADRAVDLRPKGRIRTTPGRGASGPATPGSCVKPDDYDKHRDAKQRFHDSASPVCPSRTTTLPGPPPRRGGLPGLATSGHAFVPSAAEYGASRLSGFSTPPMSRT